jgi:dipeptidyl aminopeptidase/acylaminoacyl peptidase
VEPWQTSIYRIDVRSKKVRELPGLPPGPKTGLTWSPDGRALAYASREGTDDIYGTENLELWVYDLDRSKAQCLTGKEDYCLLAIALTDTSGAVFGPTIRWAPDSRHIYLLLGWQGESHVARIPRRGGAIEFLTRGKFLHSIGNACASRLALLHGSATRLDEVAVGEFDRDGRFATRVLTNRNGALLGELQLAKPQSHWVRSAEGTKVQVWSLFPPNRAQRGRFPAVLEIHGGPHAMYGLGFFHEFQVLAAKGYAVIFSNPRGSKGYGQEHCAAIRGAWGTADWVDVQAVTEFMKEHPNVDNKRMGVMGGSYGGYMTNWVIGHTKDFAGAITDRCVSNLVSMAGNSDFPQVPDTYWPGNQWDRPDVLWEQSPVRYLGACKTPTLIIHSEGDLRCNIEQAEQVHAVLTLRGIPSRFVRYPRETSHGLSRGGPPDLRVHRLQEILDWWEKWL